MKTQKICAKDLVVLVTCRCNHVVIQYLSPVRVKSLDLPEAGNLYLPLNCDSLIINGLFKLVGLSIV